MTPPTDVPALLRALPLGTFTGTALIGPRSNAKTAEMSTPVPLPPNLPGLHAPEGFALPDAVTATKGPVAKLSHGMGGHNALLLME